MEKIDELIADGERVKTSCYKHTSTGGYLTGEDYDKWLYECKLFVNQYCQDIDSKKQINDVIDRAHAVGSGSYSKLMGFLRALKNSEFLSESPQNKVNKNKKIFVSHCSKNRTITDRFVNLLKMIGIDHSRIYYSSYEETGADYLENCLDSIKKEFEENELMVIFMISREFYSSNVCLAEMGATWVKNEKYIPIILPPLGYADIKGVVDPMQNSIMLLDEDIETKLDKLKDTLENFIGVNDQMQLTEWTREKNNFIKEIKSYSSKIRAIDNCIEAIKIIDEKIVLKIGVNNNTNNRYEFEEIHVKLKLKDGQEIKKEVDDWTIKSIVLRPFDKISFYINFENENNIKAARVKTDESEVTIEYYEVK